MNEKSIQKISVNLSTEVFNNLKEMANKDNVTMTETLRRAISVLNFVQKAQEEDKVVLLKNPKNGDVERVLFW